MLKTAERTKNILTWTCTKRNGRTVSFDTSRIQKAILKCLEITETGDVTLAEKLTNKIVKALASRHEKAFSVEDIQRVVIQQLWVEELFEAAEQYQNYREKQRLKREEKEIPTSYSQAVAQDLSRFPNPLQYYQFISKFARWREQDKRRETWREACDRVMNWFKALPKVKLLTSEWAELDASLYNLETCCAMRVVQMAGPALDRCHVGVYNCAYTPLDDLKAFAELLYILMAGTGCGFSVEDQYISQLPRIERQKGEEKLTYVVVDSTEGWCDAYYFGLQTWFQGGDVWFDVSNIRAKGSRLKVKGGRASGPGPLVELLSFARKLILSKQGKVLTDIDCHDLACMTGRIVQVGGVRRAACISFSDLDSQAMREAKSGNWYERAKQRTMSNNSSVYNGRPDIDTFLAEMTSLVKSKSGERGIFNLKAVLDSIPFRRKKDEHIRANPCAEILLKRYGLCNLSIVVARYEDTPETLKKKVRLATYWGCIQKTATNFNYLRKEWAKNCEDEALIGVDITGHADCPLLRYGAPGREDLLRELKAEVARVDDELSERFGVNRSAADTCIKPSGDSAAFFDCGSGISPWFDSYVLRWVREQDAGPVAKMLKAEGVPNFPAPEDPSLTVFGFLRKAPEGSPTAKDYSALEQLENWKIWKLNWAEHSVSCTVYVGEEEWPEVIAWLWKHFDQISGLSFLPRDNGMYSYAPNESLTKEQYEEALKKFPNINWAKLFRFEDEDETTSRQTLACTAGGCAI